MKIRDRVLRQGTTGTVLLPYTKKEKWSYEMKRVINNKTKNQNDLSACSEQLGRYKLAHYLL